MRIDYLKHINIITVHFIQNNSDYYSGEYEISFRFWTDSSSVFSILIYHLLIALTLKIKSSLLITIIVLVQNNKTFKLQVLIIERVRESRNLDIL